MLAERLIEK